eukprot:6214350-Pyramimonas_sp.AAC.1
MEPRLKPRRGGHGPWKREDACKMTPSPPRHMIKSTCKVNPPIARVPFGTEYGPTTRGVAECATEEVCVNKREIVSTYERLRIFPRATNKTPQTENIPHGRPTERHVERLSGTS